MRFDDMIATVLAQPAVRPDQRATQWRQLVDLLAQRRGDDSPEFGRACEFLREHRGEVRLEVRRAAARSLSGLPVAPELLALFAEDHPTVARDIVAGARLDSEAWIRLLPSLGPTARALLRHRRDLGPEVSQALGAFGPSDFVLEGHVPARAPASPTPAAEQSESQIRDLVARIEAFRKQKEEAPPSTVPAVPEENERVEEFCWETGADGIVVWVEAAPRGPLIGQSIAATAERGQYGVDGQASGAFEKRAPFRDARFSVAGDGAVSGDWRISGVPFFDPRRGNFLGYRGTARRPRLDEVARPDVQEGVFGTEFPADSLRQLIHELRTPLNAIIGFSEMIEGQYMGPAGAGYRDRAGDITEQARRLLSAVDDLDTAARIESRRIELDDRPVDAVALLCRLHDAYERVAQQRGAHIAMHIATGLPPARVESGMVERMFSRMLAATIGLARGGETISAKFEMRSLDGKSMLCLSLDRPGAIGGLGEAALLDPGYSPDGDWPGAPALGLGFALRLVRNLAEAVGGGLLVGDSRFSLFLPAAEPGERAAGQSCESGA